MIITLKNQLIWIVLGLIEDNIVAGDAFREQKIDVSYHGSFECGGIIRIAAYEEATQD